MAVSLGLTPGLLAVTFSVILDGHGRGSRVSDLVVVRRSRGVGCMGREICEAMVFVFFRAMCLVDVAGSRRTFFAGSRSLPYADVRERMKVTSGKLETGGQVCRNEVVGEIGQGRAKRSRGLAISMLCSQMVV